MLNNESVDLFGYFLASSVVQYFRAVFLALPHVFVSWFMVAIFRYLMVNDSWLCAGVQTYIISPRPFFWTFNALAIVRKRRSCISLNGHWMMWSMMMLTFDHEVEWGTIFFRQTCVFFQLAWEVRQVGALVEKPQHIPTIPFWAPEFSIIFTHPMPDWLSLLTILPVHVHGIR